MSVRTLFLLLILPYYLWSFYCRYNYYFTILDNNALSFCMRFVFVFTFGKLYDFHRCFKIAAVLSVIVVNHKVFQLWQLFYLESASWRFASCYSWFFFRWKLAFKLNLLKYLPKQINTCQIFAFLTLFS